MNITVSKIKSDGLRRTAIVLSFPFIVIAQLVLCLWAFLCSVLLNWATGVLSIVLGFFSPALSFFINLYDTQRGVAKTAAQQWKKQ
jgi:hypothetical protein